MLDQALAAHNNGGVVIAQVKRLARGRTLPAQDVRVPGIVVDAIVVAPDQLQTTQTVLLPEAADAVRAPISELELAPWGPEKVVARRASQELRDGEAVEPRVRHLGPGAAHPPGGRARRITMIM